MRDLLRVTACLAIATTVATASAHEVGLSRGDYALRGKVLEAHVVFARKDFIALVAGLDRDHDGLLTEAELAAAHDSIQGAIVGRVKIGGDGRPCEGVLDRTALEDQDGASIVARYTCAERPRRLTVALGFFDDLAFGHRHLARLVAGTAAEDAILSQRTASVSLDVPADATEPPPPADAPRETGGSFAPMWRVAAFVLALASVSGLASAPKARSSTPLVALVGYVVAAVLGHVLVARGLFVPGPLALGVATSVSLMYAGLEAFRSARSEHTSFDARPWALLAPFGVVHGMAFDLSIAPWLGALALGALVAFGIDRLPRKLAGAAGVVVLVAGAIDLASRLRAYTP